MPNYRKNEDGTYTAFKYMHYDGTMLETTAENLDNAKEMFKKELIAYRSYELMKTNKKFISPSKENGIDHVYARDDLAEVINKEVKENE